MNDKKKTETDATSATTEASSTSNKPAGPPPLPAGEPGASTASKSSLPEATAGPSRAPGSPPPPPVVRDDEEDIVLTDDLLEENEALTILEEHGVDDDGVTEEFLESTDDFGDDENVFDDEEFIEIPAGESAEPFPGSAGDAIGSDAQEFPTDEHEIVIDDGPFDEADSLEIIEEEDTAVTTRDDAPTGQHDIIIDEKLGRDDGSGFVEEVSVGDGFFEDETVDSDSSLADEEMIDFGDQPRRTGLRFDPGDTQEVNIIEESMLREAYENEETDPGEQSGQYDATVEISETDLLNVSSREDARAVAARPTRSKAVDIDEPDVPLHTPASPGPSDAAADVQAAEARRRKRDAYSGSQHVASSPHADLDKQLRWILGLLVIALIAALIALAVVLGIFNKRQAAAAESSRTSGSSVIATLESPRADAPSERSLREAKHSVSCS